MNDLEIKQQTQALFKTEKFVKSPNSDLEKLEHETAKMANCHSEGSSLC